MPILENKKLIFLHVPKAGGSTLLKSFDIGGKTPALMLKDQEHCTLNEMINEGHNDKVHEYKKLMITRHPAERLISAFKYLTAGRTKKYSGPFMNMTWREFLEARPWRSGINPRWFFRPQIEMVMIDGRPMEEGVIRMDLSRMNDNWETIQNLFGSKAPMTIDNSTGKRMHYSHYFDEEFKSEVMAFYKDDFNYFGYSWEDKPKSDMWNFIDRQYVINLDRRPGRLDRHMKQCKEVGLNPERIPGVEITMQSKWHGAVGCCIATLNALNKGFSDPKVNHVLLMEDDCQWEGDLIQLAYGIDEALANGFSNLWLGNNFLYYRRRQGGGPFKWTVKRTGNNTWTGKGLVATHANVFTRPEYETYVMEMLGNMAGNIAPKTFIKMLNEGRFNQSLIESTVNLKHSTGWRRDVWMGNRDGIRCIHPMPFVQFNGDSDNITHLKRKYGDIGRTSSYIVSRYFDRKYRALTYDDIIKTGEQYR